MRINHNMDSVMQIDIKQEKLDYLSDEENRNIHNMNVVVKSEIDEEPMLTNHNSNDDRREDTHVTTNREVNDRETGEMQDVNKYRLHTQVALKEFTTSERENDNFETMNIAMVNNNNNTNDYSRYLKCPQCSFETSSVTDFDLHLQTRHNLPPKILQCQSCSYNTKNKPHLIRHFRRKHDNTSEVYNCKQCEFKTIYKPDLKRHCQCKHDENSLFVCGHCHYTTKRKHSLNRHIKMKHCDKTITLKCAYCEYTTKWNQCLQRHVSAMHFDKQKQNGLEPLTLYEQNIIQSSISQGNQQDNGRGNLQHHVGLKNDDTTSIKANKIKDRDVGIPDNLNVNNLLLRNCSVPVPVSIATSNILNPVILVNYFNVIQNLNDINRNNKPCSPLRTAETDPPKFTPQDSDRAKQQNSTVITECGNTETFRCEFCDYTTGSKAYLSRHQRKDHAEAIQATLRCEYCSYKSNCRSELTRHFKLKHDKNSAVFECAFCPFKTKYKPEFNRHYKVKHDDSSQSFVCGFCCYCTKRRHSLIRHIKMKHNEDTEKLKCHECDYTTKWKQSLKTHVKLKHASSGSRLTVQHIKEEIKSE